MFVQQCQTCSTLVRCRTPCALLEATEKLNAAVGIINNVDEFGALTKIAHATEALESFNMTVCPDPIHHRPHFAAAIEKGKGVTELGKQAKKAAEAIRDVWTFLDRRAKQIAAPVTKQTKTKAGVRA